MRKHTLNLLGGPAELRISAPVLVEAVGALLEGARLAARFAVEGESVRKGPRPAWLDAAAEFDVTGLAAGSVSIAVEARTLGEVDATRFGAGGQRALFDDADERFGEKTAVDIFGELLGAILSGEREDVVADRALLESCARFARVSGPSFSGVQLGGLRGRCSQITISPKDAPRIELLRDETPRPQAARVAGRLDTVSATRSDVEILLKDGNRVPGRMETHDLDELKSFLGQEVVVSGTAHYRPSGRLLFMNVERLDLARPEDRIFQRAPTPMRQKVAQRFPPREGPSGISSFFGTWPGDETDAELLEALREIG